MDAKKKLSFVSFFLLLLLVALGFILNSLPKKTVYKEKAQVSPTPASLTLTSSAVNYVRGSSFTVDINLSTGGINTSGTSARLKFDPAFFQVLEVIPGKDLNQPQMYQNILRNTLDPQGIIYLDAGVTLSTPIYFNGQGIFGRVRFQVQNNAPLGQSTIFLFLNNASLPNQLGDCDVVASGADAGKDILGQVTNLTISIVLPTPAPTFSPTPTNSPAPRPTATPTPTITPQPTATPTATKTPTPTPTPTATITLTPTPTPIPGDIDGDGYVTMVDYAIFVSKYGGNDSSCDFNKNGFVEMGDYTILVNNYGH